MNFEINKEEMQDMIASKGKEFTIDTVMSAFRVVIETAVADLEQENKN